MLRLPRFLLYWLATAVGLGGLLLGGLPLLKYAFQRLEGKGFNVYLVISPSDRFSCEVIVILSLLLLIVVHIGHVLAGGLRFAKTPKSASVKISAAELPPSPPKESSLVSNATPAASTAESISANEKLAHLVQSASDKPVS